MPIQLRILECGIRPPTLSLPFRGGRVREEARSKKILTKKDKIVYILAGEKSPKIF
jgi:hypothetical protein